MNVSENSNFIEAKPGLLYADENGANTYKLIPHLISKRVYFSANLTNTITFMFGDEYRRVFCVFPW